MPRHTAPIAAGVKETEAPLQHHTALSRLAGRSLVMVGMMGCGKSTIGRRLAHRLGLPFVDADSAIEAAASMPVSEIFSRFGEAHFRDGERRVIARLMGEGQQVIATGGGAFVDDQTRELVLREGVAIWLDAEIDTLVQRVSKRGGRPLLAGRDPRTVISNLMAVRSPAYQQAQIRVPSVNGPHEQVVDAIIRALSDYPPE